MRWAGIGPRTPRSRSGRGRDGFGAYRRPIEPGRTEQTCDHAFTRRNFGIYHGDQNATPFSPTHLGIPERKFASLSDTSPFLHTTNKPYV